MNLRNCLVGSVAALLLGVGVGAIAQDATTNASSDEPKSSSHVRIPTPYNLLPDLSDDQQSKIKDIHSEILDEQKALKQKEHDEIADVLTDDQKKELDELVVKAALEKKANEEERRAKEAAEKADSLKDKLDNGAATQPSGGQ
jgi:membrane protein involved in colicin uptake